MKQITLAQFGVGPIGVESIRLAAKMPWARIVGAVDIDPAKIGRSLAELTGMTALSSARVYGSCADLWSGGLAITPKISGAKPLATSRRPLSLT